MNYDYLNKIYDHWKNNVIPQLEHKYQVTSFDEYMRCISLLKWGSWIKDGTKCKFEKIPLGIDDNLFLPKFKDKCVTYNVPLKPEDGTFRIIYQISKNIHLEMALWIWNENEDAQSYLSPYVIYNYDKKDEFNKFLDELYQMRRIGKTEDKKVAGFALK